MDTQTQVKSLVGVVMELYKLTTPESRLRDIIGTYYAANADFENPLVNVHGGDDIMNHFMFHRVIFMQKEELSEPTRPRTSYSTSIELVHCAFNQDDKTINLELKVHYHIRPIVVGFIRDMVCH